MPVKTIVCLANSFRHGGSCVAGIEYENGQFSDCIRPTSHRNDHAINNDEKTCSNGERCNVLDILKISFDQHVPMGHQTENWLITQNVRWTKTGRLDKNLLVPAIQNPPARLWHSMESTQEGRRDKVSRVFANIQTSSLELIQPNVATINVVPPEEAGGRAQIWVSFNWAGLDYKLKLTDPVQFARFQNGDSLQYQLANPMMCISLAEVWDVSRTASKLVASLIP